MIMGYFDQFGTPWVEGRLIIQRLEVDGPVSFLVDTGADLCALHPPDGITLQCRLTSSMMTLHVSLEGLAAPTSISTNRLSSCLKATTGSTSSTAT